MDGQLEGAGVGGWDEASARELAEWAQQCPTNFLAPERLVSAELFRGEAEDVLLLHPFPGARVAEASAKRMRLMRGIWFAEVNSPAFLPTPTRVPMLSNRSSAWSRAPASLVSSTSRRLLPSGP